MSSTSSAWWCSSWVGVTWDSRKKKYYFLCFLLFKNVCIMFTYIPWYTHACVRYLCHKLPWARYLCHKRYRDPWYIWRHGRSSVDHTSSLESCLLSIMSHVSSILTLDHTSSLLCLALELSCTNKCMHAFTSPSLSPCHTTRNRWRSDRDSLRGKSSRQRLGESYVGLMQVGMRHTWPLHVLNPEFWSWNRFNNVYCIRNLAVTRSSQ